MMLPLAQQLIEFAAAGWSIKIEAEKAPSVDLVRIKVQRERNHELQVITAGINPREASAKFDPFAEELAKIRRKLEDRFE